MRTANRLTATSIRDFILGSGLNFFGYNFQKQISKSSKKSFVVILWLNFALVTFRSCAVMYRNVGYWDLSWLILRYWKNDVSCGQLLVVVSIFSMFEIVPCSKERYINLIGMFNGL